MGDVAGKHLGVQLLKAVPLLPVHTAAKDGVVPDPLILFSSSSTSLLPPLLL